MLAATPVAWADTPCYCDIKLGNTPLQSLFSVHAYADPGAFPPPNYLQNNQNDCNSRCSAAASNAKNGNAALVTAACNASGSGTMVPINAVAKYGSTNLPTQNPIGYVVRDTVQTCPSGWLSNLSNLQGGPTQDGKCKKVVQQLSGTPLPPDGTPVGTWGFVSGNNLFAWGTTANGGAAIASTGACHL
jgi:hypothetical protein